MMSLYIMLTGTLALSGLVIISLTLLYESPAGDARKLHQLGGKEGRGRPINNAKFRRMAIINSIESVSLVYALTYVLYPYIFSEKTVSLGRIVWEGVAVLALYDFFYYLVHRYAFHESKLLRRVHSVHHVVKNPSAVDSLYLHPVENFLGLSLVWACTALVAALAGPVSVYSFAWAFVVYSLLNIVIHSGLRLPSIPFGPVNYLTGRHQKHHLSMKAKNYSSVTPIFDLIFGTEVKNA